MGALKLENLPRYTYKDYTLWDGEWELIDGIIYAMSPSPTEEHQDISKLIAFELYILLKKCKRCKDILAVDWRIDTKTVVCPDNYVVCSDNFEKRKFNQTTPSIIFEILSPSTRKKDETIKFELYEENGVDYYVMIEQNKKSAKIYKLKNAKYEFDKKIKNGKYNFKLNECNIKFNFGNIFE